MKKTYILVLSLLLPCVATAMKKSKVYVTIVTKKNLVYLNASCRKQGADIHIDTVYNPETEYIYGNLDTTTPLNTSRRELTEKEYLSLSNLIKNDKEVIEGIKKLNDKKDIPYIHLKKNIVIEN